MTFAYAVWRFLRSLPTTLYATFGAVAALVCVYAWFTVSIQSAYARGHRDTVNAARFDSTLVALVDSSHAKAKAKTDTVIRTVTKIARRVDSIHVADTIRLRYPVVDTLVIESRALVVAVDSLTRTITAERISAAYTLTLTRQQLQQSRLEVVREHDARLLAEKRPTRLRAFGYSLASAAIGYGAGRLR